MGRPLPGYDVVLLDADGSPADEGDVSIRLDPRPVGLMEGYPGDPAKAVAPAGDIFYRTGDVARQDGDGPLVHRSLGRRVQIVGLPDLAVRTESVAIEHPAIVEAAVVPAPIPCVSRYRSAS
jgi:acetyl-CoA synthetase